LFVFALNYTRKKERFIMNAKKVTTLLLCGAGIAMLAACSGKGVTRADAEKLLTDMDTAIKADTFKAPTKVTVTTESSVAEYSADDFFAHKKFSAASSYTDKNSSKVSVTANTEAWVYVKDSVAIYAVDDGTNKQYAEGLVDATKAIPTAKSFDPSHFDGRQPCLYLQLPQEVRQFDQHQQLFWCDCRRHR
jgi:hypothetical protein